MKYRPNNGFEIEPKYYSFNGFLLLTRILSLQDVFLRNMFYVVYYYIVVLSRLGDLYCTKHEICECFESLEKRSILYPLCEYIYEDIFEIVVFQAKKIWA